MTRRSARVGALLLLGTAAAPARAQVPAGGPFLVNSYTPDQQSRPVVASYPRGNFVIAWESYGQDGSGWGVFAQRFDAAGARQGGEFRAHASAGGSQVSPAVSGAPNGDFVVAWEVLSASGGARRFTVMGAPAGAEFGRSGFNPGVAAGPGGRSAVVTQAVDSQNSLGVFGSVFAQDGVLIAEFRANQTVDGHQRDPDVAAQPGGFVVVWEDYPAIPTATTIVGQLYDAAGSPRGLNFTVSGPTPGSRVDPSVAAAASGEFVVVYSTFGGTIFAQRFDAGGGRLGAELIVNTFTTGFRDSPAVAADAKGNFVVAWEGYGPGEDTYFRRGIFARRFRADGTPRGEDFHVNTFTTGDQKAPDVGSDEYGNFVVAWWDPPADPSQGVTARRFGGLLPEAFAVDTARNGVFEPGEVVDVVPSWRNVSGAAQTIGGSAVGFTGPPGAVYQVNTPFANYGTISSGDTHACLDCYRVAVPTTVRPVLHWDAVFDERLTPDAQGQEKLWRVHLGASFTDVTTSSPFYGFVERLLHHGVTGGCGADTYCPSSASAREQMSVFVLVAKEGAGYQPPACTTPVFGDVPASSPFCPFIEELSRRAVVAGCGGGNFCPAAPVSREQMPVFVLRTLDPTLEPPACGTPVFADVPASSPFCRWIEELFRRGIVAGCGGGNYCPADPVTREQMAVFIAGAFGLTLYGP